MSGPSPGPPWLSSTPLPRVGSWIHAGPWAGKQPHTHPGPSAAAGGELGAWGALSPFSETGSLQRPAFAKEETVPPPQILPSLV